MKLKIRQKLANCYFVGKRREKAKFSRYPLVQTNKTNIFY